MSSSLKSLGFPPARPGNELCDSYAADLFRDAGEFHYDIYQAKNFTGSVCFVAGEPFKWSETDALPHTVVPGVLMVSANGKIYRAKGGDAKAGARKWELIYTP